jgi:hypothetical protein
MIPEVEQAVLNGEKVFTRVGCSMCHVPALPLDQVLPPYLIVDENFKQKMARVTSRTESSLNSSSVGAL